jgi:DNA polymerase III alpha subunit
VSGTRFEVTLKRQPSQPLQNCVFVRREQGDAGAPVAIYTGTIEATDIRDVDIACTTRTFTVGGASIALGAPLAETQRRISELHWRVLLICGGVIAGTVVAVKTGRTKTGNKMAWVRFSDAEGSFEVTFFAETLARADGILTEGSAVIVTTEVRMDGDTVRLTAQEVEPLEKVAQNMGTGIRLWLDQTAAVDHIRALLGREGKGRGRVVLVPMTGPGQEVEIALPGLFNVSPRLMQAMKVVPGISSVEEI